jgi:hypothetical protein
LTQLYAAYRTIRCFSELTKTKNSTVWSSNKIKLTNKICYLPWTRKVWLKGKRLPITIGSTQGGRTMAIIMWGILCTRLPLLKRKWTRRPRKSNDLTSRSSKMRNMFHRSLKRIRFKSHSSSIKGPSKHREVKLL